MARIAYILLLFLFGCSLPERVQIVSVERDSYYIYTVQAEGETFQISAYNEQDTTGGFWDVEYMQDGNRDTWTVVRGRKPLVLGEHIRIK